MEDESDRQPRSISVLSLLAEGLINVALVIATLSGASLLILIVVQVPKFLNPQVQFYVEVFSVLLSPIPTTTIVGMFLLKDLAIYFNNLSDNSYDPLINKLGVLYSPSTLEEVIKPLAADWHAECIAALKQQRVWKAWWISFYYVYIFTITLIVSTFLAFFDRFK